MVLFITKGAWHDVCLLAVVFSEGVCSVVFCSRINPRPDTHLRLSMVVPSWIECCGYESS